MSSDEVIHIPDDVTSVRMAVVFTGFPSVARIEMTISTTEKAIDLVVRMSVGAFRARMALIREKYNVEWSSGSNLWEQIYTVYKR